MEVVKPSFARGYKWTVRDSRGNFFIDVEDEPFLNQVQEGKISFTKGDILRTRLVTETWRDDSGALRSRYVVKQVTEIVHARKPEQSALPYEEKPKPKRQFKLDDD